ncbi:N-acetyltransferase [Chitinophaga pendula]|uniref:GNAT family N-acetyltransferase n=1 Tax=Chitinophaga TaxID=79328 RepID=UPI000BAE903D|nr:MULTISPECIES: N-acetyltransferase [Chitinophaga]ASZ14228.1 hypothetical protein CK934_26390 [Chitinophaga sp. MD30]UCJ08132.1 N-acetyltransferase [Chitinophaga pendula]
MSKNFEIVDNKEAKQFEARINGQLAKVIYEKNGNKIFLTGAEVPATLEEKGVTPLLFEKVMEEISAQNVKMVPTSRKVAAYVRSNPKWKQLLVHGIHI